MIPLAFNFDGEAFELPPTAVGWRVKRLRAGKGAPELVYNSDGVPLVISLDTDMEELRRTVVVPGKYRLDPVDEQHRVIKSADAAYVLVRATEPVPPTVEPSLSDGGPNANAVIMEAMRQNSELARTIVDRFPAMLEASAVLLRAADGAGLPARKPVNDERTEREDDDEDDDDNEDNHDDGAAAPAPAPKFDLGALLAQLVPVVMMMFGKSDLKVSDFAEMLDWRRAAMKRTPPGGAAKPAPAPGASDGKPAASAEKPAATTTPDAKPASEAAPAGGNDAAGAGAGAAPASAATDALPPLSPQAMAHFMAIQSALTPEESALARAAAAELSPADRRAWIEQLTAMSVPDAVARVRKLLGLAKTEAA